MAQKDSMLLFFIMYKGWSQIGNVWNLFDSIQNFAIRLIRKEQKIFEKFDENQFEFDSFHSTPTIGVSQIFRNWIRSKFVRFDLKKIYNSNDSEGEKYSKNLIKTD